MELGVGLFGVVDPRLHVARAECLLGFDPASASSVPPAIVAPDADTDGVPDALDPAPSVKDADGDGIRDGAEFRTWWTDMTLTDSDGDGCTDGREAASVNADLVVSSGDLGLVAAHFPSAPYVVGLDVIRDGVISSGDLGFIASEFGACP